MKYWALFTGLKVVELSAIVYLPYALGAWLDPTLAGQGKAWLFGFFIAVVVALCIFLACIAVAGLIEVNKKLTNKILGRPYYG